jgi:hypothetical protein
MKSPALRPVLYLIGLVTGFGLSDMYHGDNESKKSEIEMKESESIEKLFVAIVGQVVEMRKRVREEVESVGKQVWIADGI